MVNNQTIGARRGRREVIVTLYDAGDSDCWRRDDRTRSDPALAVPPPAPQAGTVERSTPVAAAEEPDAALALDIVLSFTAECMVENLALGLPGSGAFLC